MEPAVKEVLYSAICEYLPYSPMVFDTERNEYTIVTGVENGNVHTIFRSNVPIETVRPVLRQLDSMSDEEKEVIRELTSNDLTVYGKFMQEGHGLSIDGTFKFMHPRQLEFLRKCKFDIYDLISKDLAIPEHDKSLTQDYIYQYKKELGLFRYDIWQEGFSMTGANGEAQCLATGVRGSDFLDAVCRWWNSLSEDEQQNYGNFSIDKEDGVAYLWGCKLFSNEEDARKSFG